MLPLYLVTLIVRKVSVIRKSVILSVKSIKKIKRYPLMPRLQRVYLGHFCHKFLYIVPSLYASILKLPFRYACIREFYF